jgi:hypothetical protein
LQPVQQQIADPVAVLKARLAGAPFHLKLSDQTDPGQQLAGAAAKAAPSKPAPAPEPGVPAWLGRLPSVVASRNTVNKPVRRDNFLIEGVMR